MSRGRILLRAGVAAFVAVMLAGPGAAVFPSTMRWASPVACPAGSTPAPRTFHASYHRPGERGLAFYCVAADGTEHERTLAAMGGLWLMYFMGILVLLSVLALRRPADDGARAAAGAAPAARPVPPEVEARARELLARDQKIHAIRIVREATGMGLKEAKDWVEALPHRPAGGTARGAPPSVADPRLALDIVPPGVEADARALVAGGQAIAAIKLVREFTGLGLKEAKEWVDALPLRPPRAATPETAAADVQLSPAYRLAELKRMLDTGLITAAEFEAKKSEILAEL